MGKKLTKDNDKEAKSVPLKHFNCLTTVFTYNMV